MRAIYPRPSSGLPPAAGRLPPRRSQLYDLAAREVVNVCTPLRSATMRSSRGQLQPHVMKFPNHIFIIGIYRDGAGGIVLDSHF